MLKMRLTILLLLLIQSSAIISTQAQPPGYSLNRDTVHWGDVAIIKAVENTIPDGPPALLGTAESGTIATVWGPEIRLTYSTDSTFVNGYPFACVLGDTLIVTCDMPTSWAADAPFLMSSLDDGLTWSDLHFVADPDTANSASNTFIYLHNRRLHAAGTLFDSQENPMFNAFAKYSTNLGSSWTRPSFFLQRSQQLISFSGGTSCGDSIIFGIFHLLGPHGEIVDSIKTARSFDNGSTWSPLRNAVYHYNQGYWHWLRYALGRVHLVYQEDSPRTLDTEIFYAHSEDWGENWSEPIVVSDDSAAIGQWPYLFASPDGKLIVSWFDYKYGNGGGGFTGDILFRISTDNGESWGPEMRLTYDQRNTASRSFIMGNQVGIVWQKGFMQPDLFYAESSDMGQTWSDEVNMTNAPGASTEAELILSETEVYLFWLDARDFPPYGNELYFRKADVEVGIREDMGETLPQKIALGAYPNPFNGNVTITLSGLKGGVETVKIFNLEGRLVKTLIARGEKITWDATDNAGRKVSSGVYFAQAETPKEKIVAKLFLLK